MATVNKLEELFKNNRDSLSEYLPWRMWDQENQCFDNNDNTMGWLWELQPLAFAPVMFPVFVTS
ncbi:Conjugal transfer protein TrbC [Desulfonema limicola]|uniref:Conjugal transfer protein TrbC n=1 Tax=Desulfonema limicola TaxID=45656 RepID=A0A975B488_9BACT|nr:TraC family protein [Desulfonema limicola]QTA78496.1 Conjugal transfer protein TrbC [Desulfonema limicola]